MVDSFASFGNLLLFTCSIPALYLPSAAPCDATMAAYLLQVSAQAVAGATSK